MAIIRALVIISGCLSIAELIIYFTHWKLPLSILGLLLLFFLLKKTVGKSRMGSTCFRSFTSASYAATYSSLCGIS
ncbi:Putative effector of murein hydrolase LrgA [Suttonella ornithocola]|uniref:Effector of murein hydrolase LrgA n=1 Tax=Suttonella ornithocola TaxID=279832 RepID=A0A380MVG4_9GAMM|nr:Putative effector of murein hydrolase LrgA [Suttonella ornithocola]